MLVCGWIAGGIVVVVLGAPPQTVASREAMGFSAPPSVRLAEARRSTATRVLRMPVLGVDPDALTDTYTQARSGGRVHNAIDILAPRGTPVVAAVDGTVRKLFTSAAGGLTIYEFDLKQERVYYYAHLDAYASGLREGLFIQEGTVIGYVGTTGNAPVNTPHLHFAVEVLPPAKEWWKGEPLNPYPLLTTRASELPQHPSMPATVFAH
jgi:murein DD-endopeptidase MepM/ murein hydrolase activator NlpD